MQVTIAIVIVIITVRIIVFTLNIVIVSIDVIISCWYYYHRCCNTVELLCNDCYSMTSSSVWKPFFHRLPVVTGCGFSATVWFQGLFTGMLLAWLSYYFHYLAITLPPIFGYIITTTMIFVLHKVPLLFSSLFCHHRPLFIIASPLSGSLPIIWLSLFHCCDCCRIISSHVQVLFKTCHSRLCL